MCSSLSLRVHVLVPVYHSLSSFSVSRMTSALLCRMADDNERVHPWERILLASCNTTVPRIPSEETRSDRITAAVVWCLSRSSSLAQLYIMSKGSTALSESDGVHGAARVSLVLASWVESYFTDVVAAASDLENLHRRRADEFLVRSLVAQYISAQNKKGVALPVSDAVDLYLRLWTLRPVAECLKPVLMRLTHHRNSRRKFAQRLRREWMLELGAHSIAPALSSDETAVRVLLE